MATFFLLVVMLLSLASNPAETCFSTIIQDNYSRFEDLVLTDENIEALASAFFPTNHHTAITVNVRYHFEWNGDYPINASQNEPELNFQWSSSPVHLFINPYLLSGLSLRAYTAEPQMVKLFINTNCTYDEIADVVNEVKNVTPNHCKSSNSVVPLLNKFTSNLQSYALHRRSVINNGISSDDKGYSVYYIDPTKWSQYCVLNEEDSIYRTQRYVLNIGTLVMVLVATIGSPLLFVAMYETILNKTKDGTSKKFIIWSVCFTSLLANVGIVVSDVVIIRNIFHSKFYPSQSKEGMFDIFIFVILFTIILFCLLFINAFTFSCPMGYIHTHSHIDKKLDLPRCLNKIDDRMKCICPCFKGYYCRECASLFVAYISCSYLLELLVYHIPYIILGAIVTPIETITTVSFYIALFICFVTFLAILLKAFDTEYYKSKFTSICCCYIPLLILIPLFLGCFGCFLWYFHTYIVLVQTYNNNQGIWHVIGSILPTAVVTFFGILGKYILDKMKFKSQTGEIGNNMGEASASATPAQAQDETEQTQGETEPLLVRS